MRNPSHSDSLQTNIALISVVVVYRSTVATCITSTEQNSVNLKVYVSEIMQQSYIII